RRPRHSSAFSKARTSESSLSGSPESVGGPEHVGFWARLGATAIDALLLLVVTVPLVTAIYGREYLARSAGGFAGFWDFIIQAVAPALAVILFWRYCGATPGKIAFSAKIVDAQSGR